jgi:hypothetical protein
MANRPRPLVKITRPLPSAGDRYELRDVDTDHVLASIQLFGIARVGLTCPPMLSDGGPS